MWDRSIIQYHERVACGQPCHAHNRCGTVATYQWLNKKDSNSRQRSHVADLARTMRLKIAMSIVL